MFRLGDRLDACTANVSCVGRVTCGLAVTNHSTLNNCAVGKPGI